MRTGWYFPPCEFRGNMRTFRDIILIIFFFLPHPAEYGAEEFVLDAVPTLGLGRG